MITAIMTGLGLVFPPAMNLITKLFGKSDKTPEQTLSSLAATKPEYLGKYIEAQAKLLTAQKDFFNRDVVGTPSQWVIDLRASIRPITVIMGMGVIIYSILMHVDIPQPISGFLAGVISSWFGSRIK